MARKEIRESKFSAALRPLLGGEYDVIRCETAIEDGFSDILLIRKSDGLPCFIELKQIDHFTNTGYTRIDLDPIQPIFLRNRILANDLVGAAVMLRVGERDLYTFPAHKDPYWGKWVRSKLYPNEIAMPFCLKHSFSQIPLALDAAYNARFTGAALPPIN